MLVRAVVAAAFLLHAVAGIRTHFSHRFEYEDYLEARTNTEGLAIRWNTKTAILEFGMDIGSELIIAVDNAEAPVTFSLYNYRQWELYRSLAYDIVSMDGYKETLALTCLHAATTRVVFNPATDAPNSTYKIQIGRSSQYTLQVESCTSLVNHVNASISMVNMGWDSTLSEHMGIEQLGLIPIYMGMLVVAPALTRVVVLLAAYAAFASWWIFDCMTQRQYAPGINIIFAATLVSEMVECFSKVLYYRNFSATGREHSMFGRFRDVTESISSSIFLGLLMLCSLGWAWTRRYVNTQERRFFLILYLMYLAVSLVKATCDAKRQTCQAYMLSEYALKSLMLLGVIIALNYSISRLHVKLDETRWQGTKIPQLYTRLNLLRNFRWSFLAYLLLPSFILIFNVGVINPPGTWKFLWASYLVEEMFMFGIYAHLAYTLRPIPPSFYHMICKTEAVPVEAE
ncbi:Aste57867_8284 [Aphanomyces stellatus]|uniref:Aste57867_8284 protein n=1 Tax=Aphanomyces stellatus TaxID=120398 RepID=A0A485KJT4_9STRA|nr:hypothetical protein As57867_008253 [Aphanomyces stellatus]VFT85171.1 Aste57867_8284 [Aphanomyces stellatus]